MAKHKSRELRVRKVVQLANKYYEPGNQARSYKAVWRRFVYPVYPMCYRTFLNYLNESGMRIPLIKD